MEVMPTDFEKIARVRNPESDARLSERAAAGIDLMAVPSIAALRASLATFDASGRARPHRCRDPLIYDIVRPLQRPSIRRHADRYGACSL